MSGDDRAVIVRATVLGCGGSGGVPSLGTGWGVCDPTDPRNARLRPSLLVEAVDRNGAVLTRVLVDPSPDLRQQALSVGLRHLDAVIVTHAHADHIHGIDDLREVNRAMGHALDLWATPRVLGELNGRFSYCFTPLPEGATSIYKPLLIPRPVTWQEPFSIGALSVIPFFQDHGWRMETMGLRFGPLAYSTDVVELDETAFAVLDGVQTWIVDCFGQVTHPTHSHLDKTLGWIARVGPRLAVLTHMGPGLDYKALSARLPPGVIPAHDGLVLDCPAWSPSVSR
ncbi:MBL fold metallo-hydrolase [Pararhodospirillum oryzae]|uniref:Metal-dependent hydrolase n=1 Tax=Pararhodospirillum oryzae TaxID=478448 RepID=A0A512H3Y7_9PROT|nr:MBL fold metallo-hydrolase [Pararhodospirillum oryzae]GEO80151.1 metal-dependent hydrolase [Pararhodospirillum oryzae]